MSHLRLGSASRVKYVPAMFWKGEDSSTRQSAAAGPVGPGRTAQVRGQRRFDWQRFWVAQGGLIDLSDGGYLVDPETRWSAGGGRLHTLSDLGGRRALALLGEPGMGKSVALDAEAGRLRAEAESRGVTVIHEDLRKFTSDHLLYKKVFESPQFVAWKEGDGELLLQLDSLDEALLRIDTVAALIADELPGLPIERLSIRIACRTLIWPATTLMPVFKRLWGGEAVGVYEIAPLRRADVRAAALAWPVDAEAFLEQVRLANAVPFAIKPLTLNLLLRLFEAEGRLPDSIADLYRRGCLSLCEEQSANRRDAQRVGRLNPPQRYQLAGRVAAVSMLANRYAVWTGIEGQVVPEEDVTLSTLTVGSEPSDGNRVEVTRDHLREVLDTGLFSSRGDDRTGWAHQSYAEFLAAEYLIARKVPAQNVLGVLRHPSEGLVPQLAMVTAWAASLDRKLRRALIEHEPVVLLHGDLVGWDAADLAALTDALLKGLDQDRTHDFIMGIGDRYRKLAHPGLGDQLRPYVVGRDHGIVARRAAMRIAEACSVSDLRDDLLAVATDQSDDPHIRARAVAALATCGDPSIWPALRPLALDGAGPDPNNEIKGQALEILWPEHLGAADLFRHIGRPRESYFGSYAAFLIRTLPETLKREDLPAALGWATEFARDTNHMGDYQRKRLSDAIVRTAWKHIRDDEIRPLVLDYVAAAIGSQHELFVGTEHDTNEAFRKQVADDTDGRHALLRAALAAPRTPIFVAGLVSSGLLLPEDFEWLLTLSPASEQPAIDVDPATLCLFVRHIYDWSDAHFAALYDAAERWPLLRSEYSELLDGVLLGSLRANQLKEWHRPSTERAGRQRPMVDPPPAQRVRECLERFEAGDVHAWWQMNLELTLEADSRRYDAELEYRIASLPGWEEADEAMRGRILASAMQFLERAEPTVDQWIGTDSVTYSDLAAYRALVLLKELRPDTYRTLGAPLWRKWASMIVAVPRETGTEASKLHDEITADATAAAPAEIAETVLTLVRSEKQRQRNAEQPQPEVMPSFLFLLQFNPVQENQHLTAGLLRELADDQTTPQQIAAILEFLLQRKVTAAREQALSLFEPWPCAPERRAHALSAAAALLEYDMAAAWPRLWSVITADTEFGRELFLRVAHRHRVEAAHYVGLTEQQLADLYIWLARNFPHADDPDHSDGAHFVAPRDSVVHLRDAIIGILVRRGTPEAVMAMRSIVAGLPHLQWLPYHLIEADQLMRQRTWTPLTPVEVLRLADRADGRLVQSPRQLADVLVEVLRGYEAWLHGEQSPVRSLWDRQQGGTLLRPVEEDAISDHVKVFLQHELAERGIVVNREVEIGRVPGAPIGTRTDIRVDAIRRNSDGEPFDKITAVIETKGSWNAALMTAMKTQLRNDYLTRLGAPVGIYLVGWFDKPKWDKSDSRRAKSPPWDAAEAQQQLDAVAAALPAGFDIRAVVLDCHAP
ncbi:hypothetical protein KXS07_10455 [Inquilinus limosus]|uniref:NACHT domain-containing protein n=1 Tax=Inquilinus limosus TaxID=171674 RepID=UPI003F14A1F1